LPPLFNFTDNELKIQPTLNSQLIPPHVAAAAAAAPVVASVSGAQGGAAVDDAAQAQVRHF
jgi:glycogen synthase kinase 3 beta